MHPRLQVHNSAGAMVLNSSKRSKDRGYSSMKGFKYRERHQQLRLTRSLSDALEHAETTKVAAYYFKGESGSNTVVYIPDV